MESSLGSIPDTSRTDPGISCISDAEERKRRQQVRSSLLTAFLNILFLLRTCILLVAFS